MRIIKNKKGVALILSVMLMTLVLFLSMYFLNFSLSEKQISISQNTAERAYYLAEAGISDVIWKLKNDTEYSSNFVNNPSWATGFTKNNPFGPDSGSYTVTITNTSYAHGDIESIGQVNVNGKISQRIIKTKVFRAMGESIIGENAIYADGNVDVSSSNINYYNGGTHSNGNYIVNGASNIHVEGDLNAVGNYLLNWQATANINGAVHSSNFPPAPAEIPMPAVDFSSSATSSMKNRADVTYTEQQFKNLLATNSTLTIDGPVIYISGDVKITKTINVTINGILVVQGGFEIANNNNQMINLTVNHATGSPSGIMAASSIKIEGYSGNINVNGVVYANDKIDVVNVADPSTNLDFTGGLIARKVTITSSARPVNIYYDGNVLSDSFISTEFSPVITVEHWEEEY